MIELLVALMLVSVCASSRRADALEKLLTPPAPLPTDDVYRPTPEQQKQDLAGVKRAALAARQAAAWKKEDAKCGRIRAFPKEVNKTSDCSLRTFTIGR